jgi:hypothetical protein
MIKVLAAEMSDQGRLARGRRYHADNAVIDIVIGHGAVTAEVQGSRPQPYVVTIEAASGSGVPSRREVVTRCTCPDDGLYEACKHAVAALFALSDEIAVEPELIDRWRRSPNRPPDEHGSPPAPDPAPPPPPTGLAEVVPLRRPRPAVEPGPEPAPVVDPTIDEIARLLAAPGGAIAPELAAPEPIEHVGIHDRQLADVLADALAHLHLEWD